MKMIFQQAIRERICHRRDMLLVKLQEILVITFFEEDVPPVHAAIVAMGIRIVEQGRQLVMI